MKLYLVERTDYIDYDEYISFVVAAKSAKEALSFNPHGQKKEHCDEKSFSNRWESSWTSPENLKVTYLGVSSSTFKNGNIICNSYYAG